MTLTTPVAGTAFVFLAIIFCVATGRPRWSKRSFLAGVQLLAAIVIFAIPGALWGDYIRAHATWTVGRRHAANCVAISLMACWAFHIFVFSAFWNFRRRSRPGFDDRQEP